jgi:hypothetical protein
VDRELHGVEGRLVAVEEHEVARGEPVDLPGQLGADRPTRPGDQHPPAGQVPGDGVDVGVDLVPAQEVSGGEAPQLAHAHLAAEQLGDRREDQHLQVGCPRLLGHLADQRTAGRRDGDGQHRRPRLCHRGGEPLARADDGDAA